jgi:HSP20 family protein
MAGTLTRWDPFADFAQVRQRIDRMFEDMTDGGQGATRAKVDLIEKDDKLIVRADMPGIKPEDIKVEVNDDVLTIRGEHEESKKEKGESFLRRERSYKSFVRSLTLPPNLDAKAIEATTHDGVLEVAVPVPKETESKAVLIKPKVISGAKQ